MSDEVTAEEAHANYRALVRLVLLFCLTGWVVPVGGAVMGAFPWAVAAIALVLLLAIAAFSLHDARRKRDKAIAASR